MAKKDFCYCKGENCLFKMTCLRFLDGLKAMFEEGHLWMDDCGEDREHYIETKPRF